MKKYIAKSDVGLNIVLPGGANKRVSFTSQTGGGGVYYTDDADEQKGLESHYRYGKLFVCDSTFTDFAPADPITKPAPKEGVEPKIKEVEVSDPDAAKSYLAENFEENRTKLKTVEAIKKAAARHGIVFKGI